MKRRTRLTSVLVPLLCALIASPPALAAAASGPPAATPTADGRLRDQLTAFFAEAGRLAPTAVGPLSQDPAAMAELRQKIAALSPEELAAMQGAFAEVPDWQAAPEALSSAFQMQVLSDEAARRGTDLERFRAEVSEFYAALRLLPAESLARLSLDPASVAEIQGRVHDMPPHGLALLQLEMDQKGDWRGMKSSLLASLKPEARTALRAFGENGPLGDQDLKDLGLFRKDLEDFFDGLNRLPPRIAAKFEPGSIQGMKAKLRQATPEMLYLIRQRIDTPALRQAMTDVRLLARAGSFTPQEQADLDLFRADLAAVYGSLGNFTPGDSSAAPLAERVASLSHEEILLARNRVEGIPSWKKTLPAIFAAASTAEGRSRLALVEQGADPGARQALESYRAATLDGLTAARALPGLDPAAVAEARSTIEKAAPRDLLLMREAAALVPPDDTVLRLIEIPRAIFSLGSPQIQSVSFNCSCPDHGLQLPLGIGCVSLQFLCNIIAAPINLALAGIEAVVSGLQTVVSGIQGVIDDVLTFVQRIIQDIAALPNVLLNAMRSLFESIASAVLNEFSPASLAAKLGLVEGFWSSIPPLPQIPCPPDGFNLHPFGEVGDDLTASKYERYLFVFDKVLDLIPDTEISLTLKIPAQVLYGGIQYLGVCLRDAALARSEQATAAFREMVAGKLDLSLTNQGSAQTGISLIQAQVFGLQSQVAAQGLDLMSQLARQQQDFLQALMAQGQDLLARITRTGGDLGDALKEFQDLDLRLKIEADLVLEGGKNIASFQLPSAFGGVLELVRQIVAETIEAALDAGLDVHHADTLLARGDDLLAAGDYRGAYNSFAKSYREAAKGTPTPVR